MEYDKPMTKEDMEAMIHLQIFHPALLNPKYFELGDEEEPEEEEYEEEYSWADWEIDSRIDLMREEAL